MEGKARHVQRYLKDVLHSFFKRIRTFPFWDIQILNFFSMYRMYALLTISALSLKYALSEIKSYLDQRHPIEVFENYLKLVELSAHMIISLSLIVVIVIAAFNYSLHKTSKYGKIVYLICLNFFLYNHQVFSISAYENGSNHLNVLILPIINFALCSFHIWCFAYRLRKRVYLKGSIRNQSTFSYKLIVNEKWISYVQLFNYKEVFNSTFGPLSTISNDCTCEGIATIKLRYSPIKIDIHGLSTERIQEGEKAHVSC